MSSWLRSRLRRFKPRTELDYVAYWERRYGRGGTSGSGSYGDLAAYKAEVINGFIAEHHVHSVAEFGCGDGNQLKQYSIPTYLGLDVASTAVQACRQAFAGDDTKSFALIRPGEDPDIGMFDLTMSIEVLMHVTREPDFLWSLDMLFRHASRYVIIHAPLSVLIDHPKGSHEKYRDLFSYLVPYLGDFAITDVRVHPGLTTADRRNGVIGPMASDFVFLERKTGAQ